MVEELKDLNQRFEERHGAARELYGQGEYTAAIEEWQAALGLCAGRPIQELSVITGIVEACVQLEDYEEAVGLLSGLIRRKQERSLSIPAGLLERLEYLKTLVRSSSSKLPPSKRSSPSKRPSAPAKSTGASSTTGDAAPAIFKGRAPKKGAQGNSSPPAKRSSQAKGSSAAKNSPKTKSAAARKTPKTI